MDCPFCNINKEKTRIIKDGENIFVVLSNPRLMPGHILVIPKRHVEKISQLGSEEKKELFDTLIELEEKILSKLASGCDIRQHYRPFMKQGWTKVDHLHFHLHPREFEDELYHKTQIFEKEMWADLSKDELDRFSELFSN